MARGSAAASNAADTAARTSAGLSGNASALYGTVAPALTRDVVNPTGFSPADLAAMDTAAQQSTGGSEAAATGQGALLGARTRNAGAPMAAIAESTRTAGENLSRGALGTRIQNAMLKNTNRRAALGGLESLYGTNVSGANAASGQIAGDVNADTNARNASWDWASHILQPVLSAAGNSKYLTGGSP